MHQAPDMPSLAGDEPADRTSLASSISAFNYYPRESIDKLTFSARNSTRQSKTLSNGDLARPDGPLPNGIDSSGQTLANGRASGSTYFDTEDHSPSYKSSSKSTSTAQMSGATAETVNGDSGLENAYLASLEPRRSGSSRRQQPDRTTARTDTIPTTNGEGAAESVPSTTASSPQNATQRISLGSHGRSISALPTEHATVDGGLAAPASPEKHRVSSPPAFQDRKDPIASAINPTIAALQGPPHSRLQHRHTLEVPKVNTARLSKDFQQPSSDEATASGRFSPATPTRRRASLTLARRATRSIHSQINLEEIPQDEDVMRWAEHIRQKRASKRKRKEDEDDERVLVGTRVDQNHANFIMAYNMLTGIRFTVSRCNAKIDRELVDSDFHTRQKFSFDVYVPSICSSA
jgi:1-phosphatidylinositol-4-phosphate 5-kinase